MLTVERRVGRLSINVPICEELKDGHPVHKQSISLCWQISCHPYLDTLKGLENLISVLYSLTNNSQLQLLHFSLQG